MNFTRCGGTSTIAQLSILLLGTGCGGAEDTSGAGDRAVEQAQLDPIAEVAVSDTYRIAFHEPQPGMLLVSETGTIGVDTDSRITAFDSAVQLYQDVTTGVVDPTVVGVLRAADERAAEFNARQPDSDPTADDPPVENDQVIEKHSSFLNGNQCQLSSFEGNYCALSKHNQITSSDTGWQWCTKHFRSTVFNHQYTSTDSSAIHSVYYYGDKGDFWDQVASTWVQRGTWQSWHSTWKYVKATTGRTTGQVTPGNHDQCVLRDPLNSPGLFGGCSTIIVGCINE